MTNPKNYSGKIVRLGKIKGHEYSIYCGIQYHNGKLSISGVVGPKSNGDAYEDCGQIIMGFKEYDHRGYRTLNDIVYAEGWSKKLAKQFFDVWDAWHLNDMRANCKHQIGEEWKGHDIQITKYHLSYQDQIQLKHSIEKQTDNIYNLSNIAALKRVIEINQEISNAYILIEAMELGLTEYGGSPLLDGISPEQYPFITDRINRGEIVLEAKTETKWSGHTYPSEHPEGILTKPCPVCGYKYGSAWRFEPIPKRVFKFLDKLPHADMLPAWI